MPRHAPTGRTLHTLNGEKLEPPAAPAIIKLSSESGDGFYLMYLASAGREIIDTLHDSITGAHDQARFEFGIPDSDWEDGS
jgi:hypothetical protein